MDASKARCFPLLFLTFFFWGSVYVAGKLISDTVPAALVACLRCVVAIVPLSFMARKHFKIKIEQQDKKYFLLVGGIGYFLTIFLVQTGIAMTGASMAALVNSLTPVSVAIMAALILKERITPITLVCLCLAITGTLVVTSGSGGKGETGGIIMVLISVVCWGIASVYMRRLTAKYPPVLVTTYGIAISLLFHIPVGLFTAVTQPVTLTLPILAVILYLGITGSAISQYTWTKCLSILPASTCSLFYPLQPVFSAILGVFILGERFAPSFFVGLVLISADVALSTWETRRQSVLGK